MKWIVFLFTAVLILNAVVTAQGKYFTKSGKIDFFSTTPAEDIKAINKSVSAVLDTKTGDLQFSVLMKGFQFKKGLMQEHFNDRYVESKKYPLSEFKGQISNNGEINYTTNGTYNAKVKGMMTIHGVTKELEITGTLTVKDGKIGIKAVFNLTVADYKINIPAMMRESIAKSIKVTVDCLLGPLP